MTTPHFDTTSPSPTIATTSALKKLSPDDQPTIHQCATDPISAMNSTHRPLSPAHSAQPLTSFTIFPKFPIELRLKIFKMAIPTGPKGYRMLEVKVELMKAKPDIVTDEGRRKYQWVFFLENNDHVSEIQEVSLSSTTRESRAAYLETYRHVLHGEKGSLIRFGGDDVIYISEHDNPLRISLVAFLTLQEIFMSL
jgi:hypothetical protein